MGKLGFYPQILHCKGESENVFYLYDYGHSIPYRYPMESGNNDRSFITITFVIEYLTPNVIKNILVINFCTSY